MMTPKKLIRYFGAMIVASFGLVGFSTAKANEDAQKVLNYWTAERIASATLADLVLDERGLAYMRDENGELSSYGHATPASDETRKRLKERPQINRDLEGGTVENKSWRTGGAVQTAVGRLLFTKLEDGLFKNFVCTGTVVDDDKSGRSIILTAAHCIYDKEYNLYVWNVVFIPNQDETTGTNTDGSCENVPHGCYVVNFGVVDLDWIEGADAEEYQFDYGFYVVRDAFAHVGNIAPGTRAERVLDATVGSLPIDFYRPYFDDGFVGPDSLDFTYIIGYPWDHDPDLRYCAEDLTTAKNGTVWYLPSCGLRVGSSGGPFVQTMDVKTGYGPIISVNSFSFAVNGGVGGPDLRRRNAECLFNVARTAPFESSFVSYSCRDIR